MHFLVCKGLSIDDVGGGVEGHGISGDTIRSGAGFETVDFVKEKLGGLPWNDSLMQAQK